MSKPAITTDTHAFLAALRPHTEKPLVFDFGGRTIQSGYHVTEVKTANVQALDCGANLETWPETVVQLWDVPAQNGETHMAVGKFLSIMDRVADRMPLVGAARLLFEAGDSSGPAVHYTAESITPREDVVVVRLAPVLATCKPRDRWLASLGVIGAAPEAPTSTCCAPVAAAQGSSAAPCCS